MSSTDRLSFVYQFTLTFDNKFKGSRMTYREMWRQRVSEPLRKSLKRLGHDVNVIMDRDEDKMRLRFRYSSDFGTTGNARWRGTYESPDAVTKLLFTKYMNRQFRCGEAGTIRCKRITCDVGRYEY